MVLKKLQQFHNGFDLQDRPFRRSVIIMDFIADDLWVFAYWNISEKTNNVKANESI